MKCKALLGLAVSCGTTLAAAQSAQKPALSFEGCAEADSAEIRRLVAIDFGAAPVRGEAAYAISISCQGSTWQLSIPSAGLARSLDFASTPGSARARLTAIVVGELLAEAATERESRQAPPAPEPLARTAPPAPDRARSQAERERFRIGVMGGGRTLFGGVPRLLGAAARLDDLTLPWSLDALVEQGAVSTSQGVVSMRALSGGLSLSWQQALGGARVRLGAGVRAGAVWMQGEPPVESDVRGQKLLRGWAGPIVSSVVALPLNGRLAFQLVVEGGYTLLPVYGLVEGRREAALRGVWLGAQVGAGFAL